MTTDYLKRIKKILEDKFGVEPKDVTADSYFQDDLNLSDLEITELLTELEEELHVELMEEKENVESVTDLVDILAEKLE
jgi:acyl carrier protein